MVEVKFKKVVSCKNVIFGYSNDKPILNGVSFDLYQGESVVLFGRSGSGKSTLLRCISGYNQPTSGNIKINKISIENSVTYSSLNSDNKHAYEIAKLWIQMQSYPFHRRNLWHYLLRGVHPSQAYMVFADCDNALPQLTSEENIHLVLSPICPNLKLRKELVDVLLKLTGLLEVAQQRPSELSSGQLRRLCLAQGLAINPRLLILDEPTNGLDFSTKFSFLHFIDQLRQIVDITILSVTHDLDAALFLADRLALFEDGKIIREVHVKQPHPRQIEILDTDDFVGLRQMLMSFLR